MAHIMVLRFHSCSTLVHRDFVTKALRGRKGVLLTGEKTEISIYLYFFNGIKSRLANDYKAPP